MAPVYVMKKDNDGRPIMLQFLSANYGREERDADCYMTGFATEPICIRREVMTGSSGSPGPAD